MGVHAAILVACAVGALVASGRWLLARWGHARRTALALHAFARAHHAIVHGDGQSRTLHVVGTTTGRPFTVAWQADLIRGQVLLVAVDCSASDDARAADVTMQDGAIASRLQPTGAVDAARLDALVHAMAGLAEELEARHPRSDTHADD